MVLQLRSIRLESWREILWSEEIAEDEASNAFYKLAEGEDISSELNKY